MPQIPIADASGRKKGAPKDAAPAPLAAAKLSNTHVLPGRHTVWAQIDLTAAQAPDTDRPAIDLVPVIDCSGSMGQGPGSPREHAFEATRYALKRLGGQDRSAVVVYASEVQLVKGLSADHQGAVERLKNVTLSGMTALAPALYEGLEQLGGGIKGRTAAVWLFTDGQANEGDTDPQVIAAKVAKAAKAGIKVAAFGLGPSYNEDLLEAVAKAGGGGYYYVQSPDDAATAFAAELEGLLAITARGVKVDLRPAAGVEIKRLMGLDAEQSPVLVGDLPAEATRTLLIELEVEGSDGDRVDLLEVVTSYTDLDGKAQTESLPVSVDFSSDESVVSHGVEAEVVARVAEMEAAYAQAEAARLADQGQYVLARELIDSHRQRLAATSASSPLAAALLNAKASELDQSLSWLASAASYTSESAKLMKSSSYSTRNSRPQSAPRTP